MRCVAFGDTHGEHLGMIKWPKADLVICVGDFSTFGNEEDTIKFIEQYKNLKYPKKILICGNHDWLFERNFSGAMELLKETGITYLQDSEIVIEGIKFYGTPWSKEFNQWAFMKPERDLVPIYAQIPTDVQVLITHQPPYGILDFVDTRSGMQGSKALLNEYANKRLKPTYHVFGHIHESYGRSRIGSTHFINCSLMNGQYDRVNEPILIEIQ